MGSLLYFCTIPMVITEIKSRVGYVTLNHPEKRNALGPEMVNALKTEIQSHLQNPEVKVVVLKSSSQVFCAGADLSYLSKIRDFTREENLADSQNLRQLFDLIYNGDKIFVSEVVGPALAGGCGLATICDFCFASSESTFGYTESKIGFVPALVMVYLQHRISGNHLRDLLLTGRIVDGEEAIGMGLVNRLVLSGDMDAEVFDFAQGLCNSISGSSIKYIKTMLRNLPGMAMDKALDYAAETNADARKSEDCIKGIDSFLSKQKISW